MRKLDASSHRAMPWKNGGGITTEVARAPEGSSLDDFDWRVSMARVGTEGPFSRFGGVDRSLAILDDGAMTLAIAGRGAVRLDRDAAPFAFPADVAVAATLDGGALDDFNVMTRRGRFRHLLTRVAFDGAAHLERLGDLTLLVVASGEAHVTAAGEREHLRRRDGLLLDGDGALPLRLEIVPAPRVSLLVVDLWRC